MTGSAAASFEDAASPASPLQPDMADAQRHILEAMRAFTGETDLSRDDLTEVCCMAISACFKAFITPSVRRMDPEEKESLKGNQATFLAWLKKSADKVNWSRIAAVSGVLTMDRAMIEDGLQGLFGQELNQA